MTGTVNGKITYSHNGFFELTGMKVNNRSEIGYEYDRDGLLTKAGDLSYTRNANGLIDQMNMGVVTTKRKYSGAGELSGEISYPSLYWYNTSEKDSAGRITLKSDMEGKYTYTYNDRGYLSMVFDGKGKMVFGANYDSRGNATSRYSNYNGPVTSRLYYNEQDQLIMQRSFRYEYNESGALKKKTDTKLTDNPSDDTFTTYSYDHGGNLLKVILPNNDEIRYTSDALNRRIAKMKNGNYEYKLLYSGQLSPIARLNDEDRVVEEYVYGSRVNVPEYMIKDGRKYRFITDHRGSVRMVVDTHTGTVMQRTDYDEFGMIIDEDIAENWTPVLFGYAGGLQDRDTGLIRFGARDYDPMVGRWTSKEPLGFNGASNFYVYAENDPVNYVDVTGLKPGDYFDTMDAAARDAAEYVSSNFDDSRFVEYLAEIYEVYIGKKLCYSYIEPYTSNIVDRVAYKKRHGSYTRAYWHNHVAFEDSPVAYYSEEKGWVTSYYGTSALSDDDYDLKLIPYVSLFNSISDPENLTIVHGWEERKMGGKVK